MRKHDRPPLNIALLGYGFAGKTIHAPLILSVPGLQLTAVMSSHAEKVSRDLPDVTVRATPDEVFSDSAVELVVIATPNDTHFDFARRALSAAKHVVVDKPFTTTVAEAVELAALANVSGRLLSVFHIRRWDADFLTLRQIVERKEIGKIVHVESHYDRYRPTVLPRWRELPGPGTGIWFDLGSHLVDQVLQLFGLPEAVFADLAMQRRNAAAVDYFHVLLRYGTKRVILHGSDLVAEPPRRFEVHGTNGSYVKHGMDTQEPALRRGERPGAPGWGVDAQDGTLTIWTNDAPRQFPAHTIPGNYQAYYAAIREAIREGTRNPVTPQEGLAVVQVLELACKSSRERRELPFPK